MIFLAGGSACGKAQSPEAVDGKRSIERVLQLANKRAARKLESIDMSVAEISHKQITADAAESAGSDGESPGRIQSTLGGKSRKPSTVGAEHIDKTVAKAFDIIVFVSILQGKRDIEIAIDIANAKRGIAERDGCISEGFHKVETCVIDFNYAIVEIGGEKEVLAATCTGSESLIHGTRCGVVHHLNGIVKIDGGAPACNGSILGGEDKNGRTGLAVGRHDKAGGGIRDETGRRGWRTHRGAWNGDDKRRGGRRSGCAIAEVESGCPGAVVGDPDRTVFQKGDTPRIDEIRISAKSHSGDVGNEIDAMILLGVDWRSTEYGQRQSG